MKTQAWAWLAAGVLAAGLNASYHDGGLEFAHRVAGRVEHNVAAVLALASGRADQFVTEAQVIAAHENHSCPFATALTRVESGITGSESELDRVQAMSDREEAQLERLEANGQRIEAQFASQTAHFRVAMAGVRPADFTVRTPMCPRVRINIPRVPMVKIPVPLMHIDMSGTGPV